MTDGMKQYRRVLKRKLRCSWGVRKRLLEKSLAMKPQCGDGNETR